MVLITINIVPSRKNKHDILKTDRTRPSSVYLFSAFLFAHKTEKGIIQHPDRPVSTIRTVLLIYHFDTTPFICL